MRLGATTSAILVLAFLVGGGTTRSRAAGQTAADLAQAIQRKYDGIKDFSADFVQVYQSGVIKKQTTERGQLFVKKPGKMRWEYMSPEHNLFVSDGLKVYFYVPEDKQVTVSSVPPEDEATTPALFLAGKGNLTRDFSASLADAPAALPQGTLALKLMPRRHEADYDWLMLAVEPGTFRLRGLMTADAQGGTSMFSLTNLKENIGLTDRLFVFKPPRGVDVVSDAPQR